MKHHTTHLWIRDVTMRDGEQAPGNKMNVPERMALARQLLALGIDEIEGGFAIASPVDFAALQQMSTELGIQQRPKFMSEADQYVTFSSLACLDEQDIRAALEAVQAATRRGIHVFIGTSPEHRRKFAKRISKAGGNPDSDRDFIEKFVIPSVEQGLKLIQEIDPNAERQFSPEDWTRTPDAMSDDVILAAASNGATVINLPDTVGIGIPDVVCKRVARVRRLLDKNGFKHVRISWHGHNDTGMGVANAIAALHGGATQFEPTILGIGERNGNFSFEGFLAALDALKLHHEERIALMRRHPVLRPIVEWLMDTGVLGRGRVEIEDSLVREETMRTAQLLARILGISIAKEHPLVGRNAFRHEAGLHQAGVLIDPSLYEVLIPERYGATRKLDLGQSSGWSGTRDFLKQQGLPYSETHRDDFVAAVKAAGTEHARRKGLEDEEALRWAIYPTIIKLTGGPLALSVTDIENPGHPYTVELSLRDGRKIPGIAKPGKGRVNAIVQAMDSIIPGVDTPEEDFIARGVRSNAHGSEGMARATVTVKNAFSVTETAEDADTDVAIENALLKAFNALYALEEYAKQIETEGAASISPKPPAS